jgi:hypothetical protein
MFKSYVITEDKNPSSPRFDQRSKKKIDSLKETIDAIIKTKSVINRYSSVRHKDNRLVKSENLPTIKKNKITKRVTSIKSIITTSFTNVKLPDINRQYIAKETDSDKAAVIDKGNFTLFLKLYEIWLDIELKFDNRLECINLIKFYFRFMKEEVLSINIESDEFTIFHDSRWNVLFLRIAKIQCIIVGVLLIVLANFPEWNINELRKLYSNFSKILITFLDNYFINSIELKPTFTDKIVRIRDNMKPMGKNNVISLLLRNLDYCLTVMKNYM